MGMAGCFFPYSRLLFTNKPEESQENREIHEKEIIGDVENLPFEVTGSQDPTGPGKGVKYQLEEENYLVYTRCTLVYQVSIRREAYEQAEGA